MMIFFLSLSHETSDKCQLEKAEIEILIIAEAKWSNRNPETLQLPEKVEDHSGSWLAIRQDIMPRMTGWNPTPISARES